MYAHTFRSMCNKKCSQEINLKTNKQLLTNDLLLQEMHKQDRQELHDCKNYIIPLVNESTKYWVHQVPLSKKGH